MKSIILAAMLVTLISTKSQAQLVPVKVLEYPCGCQSFDSYPIPGKLLFFDASGGNISVKSPDFVENKIKEIASVSHQFNENGSGVGRMGDTLVTFGRFNGRTTIYDESYTHFFKYNNPDSIKILFTIRKLDYQGSAIIYPDYIGPDTTLDKRKIDSLFIVQNPWIKPFLADTIKGITYPKNITTYSNRFDDDSLTIASNVLSWYEFRDPVGIKNDRPAKINYVPRFWSGFNLMGRWTSP